MGMNLNSYRNEKNNIYNFLFTDFVGFLSRRISRGLRRGKLNIEAPQYSSMDLSYIACNQNKIYLGSAEKH